MKTTEAPEIEIRTRAEAGVCVDARRDRRLGRRSVVEYRGCQNGGTGVAGDARVGQCPGEARMTRGTGHAHACARAPPTDREGCGLPAAGRPPPRRRCRLTRSLRSVSSRTRTQ
eukprot:ctg_2463.g677